MRLEEALAHIERVLARSESAANWGPEWDQIKRAFEDGQRAALRVKKTFESGLVLPEGAPIYATEAEHGWIGTWHPDQKSWGSHSFALDPDDFVLLVRAKGQLKWPRFENNEELPRVSGTPIDLKGEQ